MKRVYIIGSLRNTVVAQAGNRLREHGLEAIDDWYAAGPRADDHWKEYENGRGRGYEEALYGKAAVNTFEFDYENLIRSDAALLVLPAGKSGHLEAGFFSRKGPLFILLEQGQDERYDVMYRFAIKSGGLVTADLGKIINRMKEL